MGPAYRRRSRIGSSIRSCPGGKAAAAWAFRSRRRSSSITRASSSSSVDQAVELIRRALDESRREAEAVEPVTAAPEILGHAPAMQEVFRAIGRLSQSSATVLITGESGTGKELVARALHRHSARADKPFIAINTAAMPKDLLESELFGHEPGSFTRAHAL